jgi:hypothetical protein
MVLERSLVNVSPKIHSFQLSFVPVTLGPGLVIPQQVIGVAEYVEG